MGPDPAATGSDGPDQIVRAGHTLKAVTLQWLLT